MFEVVLKVAGMIVSFLGTVVKAIDLWNNFKKSKSNRPSSSKK